MKKFYLGIEIGASKHQIALGDAGGNIIHTRQGKVALAEGAVGILKWMQENIPPLIGMAEASGGRVEAAGVGFGGIIDSAEGISLVSVQVDGWKEFNLKRWFECAFGIPTTVLNDTVAGGWGEYICGSGQGSRSFFYTNIGSGIGGVFIFDGKCYDGIGYGAAYFGHTYIPDWTSHEPGAFCKVESICSGFGIEKRLRSEGYVPLDSMIMGLCDYKRESIQCLMLEQAARAGDVFALAEIARIARSYAIGLSNVITLISPDRISIGGGVAKMGKLLLAPVREYADELAFISSKGRYEIVTCTHEDAAVVVGAVLTAAQDFDKSGPLLDNVG